MHTRPYRASRGLGTVPTRLPAQGRLRNAWKILHPVSLMSEYQESVHLALDIAQTYRAELTLLHVLDRDVADGVNPDRVLHWAK